MNEHESRVRHAEELLRQAREELSVYAGNESPLCGMCTLFVEFASSNITHAISFLENAKPEHEERS